MRTIKIKNLQQTTDIYCGQEILSQEYYEIQNEQERQRFANEEKFISHLLSGLVVLNDGQIDIINSPLNFLNGAAELITYKISSTVLVSNNAIEYTTISGMTKTPTSGKYSVFFNGNSTFSNANKTYYIAIFYDGIIVEDSQRILNTGRANETSILSTLTDIEADGTRAIEVKIKCEANGSFNITNRTLLLIRRGNL